MYYDSREALKQKYDKVLYILALAVIILSLIFLRGDLQTKAVLACFFAILILFLSKILAGEIGKKIISIIWTIISPIFLFSYFFIFLSQCLSDYSLVILSSISIVSIYYLARLLQNKLISKLFLPFILLIIPFLMMILYPAK